MLSSQASLHAPLDALKIDIAAARLHLELLGYTEEDSIFLRKFPPKGVQGYPKNLETTLSRLPTSQTPDGGMYFVVNGGGHKKADVIKARSLFWEYDDRPREEQIDCWQKFGLPEPTIQVLTRKSVHSYLAIEDCTLEQWDELQQDLLEFIDADRTLKDRSRVMRLAGAWHIAENEEPVQCEIISHSGRKYGYEYLRSIVPPRPEPQKYIAERCLDDRSLSYFLRYDLLPRFGPERAFNWGGHKWQKTGGHNKLRGCCPWHESKSGTAFYVDEKDGIPIWRCPSCDIGGTVIEYRHRLAGGNGRPQGKEFIELVKSLAEEVGLEVPGNSKNDQSHGRSQPFPQADSLVQGGADSPEMVVKLQQAIAQYANETDPFKKILLESQIGQKFGVRGQKLDFLVQRLNPPERSKATSLHDLMPAVFASVERLALNPGLSGIPSGFSDLDEMTGGWQNGELIIVAGRPAMGKSAFVMNVGTHAASLEKKVAVFSLEMSKESLTKRLIAAESEIDLSRINRGRVYQNEWDRFGTAASWLSKLPLEMQDEDVFTLQGIVDSYEKDGPYDLVIIDYLQLIESDTGNENRTQELSKTTRKLKNFAREWDVPIICLSQLSRGVEGRSDKRPMMSDLRESGSIEQDSDLILMLYRDEYYNPETIDRGLAEVIITKQRNGPVGTIKLLFEPRFTRFRNLVTPGSRSMTPETSRSPIIGLDDSVSSDE